MRIAVLIVNYIWVGLVGLILIGLPNSDDPTALLTGILMLAPLLVLNLVYAHKGNK